MNRMNPTWFAWAILFCLIGSAPYACEGGEPPLGPTYVTTDIGVKAIDNFPIPAERMPGAQMPAPLAPLTETFTLHSCPTATKVMYLDFDGHDAVEGEGVYYAPFNYEGPDSTFSAAELTTIQLAWKSVSEDFLPFEVDVTTEEPDLEDLRNTGGGDTRWGIRAVVSTSNWNYSWAYIGSFNWDTDYECQVYPYGDDWIWLADAASHEVGHSLWLYHDGGGGDGEYYEGHGSGLTHWSPIMGWSGYGLSQWSIGEYAGANNQEDDLLIITTQNGFGYRPDDHGSTTATATAIDVDHASLELVAEGIVERTTDIDFFAFTMPGDGDIQFAVDPIALTPDILASNLDILAKLHDAGGTVLYTSNPADSLNTAFDVSLTAGDYYLSVDGTGLDDPLGPPHDGYSDYGSLGYYSVEARTSYSTGIEASSGEAIAPALRFDRQPVSPFGSSTSFSFTLPESRRVQARVFDVRGRLVETLLDADLSAGVHKVSWEPYSQGPLAAGLYFIHIQAGHERITARTVYLP